MCFGKKKNKLRAVEDGDSLTKPDDGKQTFLIYLANKTKFN